MAEYSVYNDIRERSGGDVYIGVVGPVRTGKSTFIKRFMDLVVIPNMENSYQAERARDELPQSAGGRTIMTTEPKFVPNEAVEITLGDNAKMRVRMIDCVGYVVDGAMGHVEDGEARMVSTPWSDEPVPFDQAAEIGTSKVICDHSNIGLVITTDGSITEIDRDNYIPAEYRVISELKAINKPFVVLLNTKNPNSRQARQVKEEIEFLHGVPVIAVNCMELTAEDINSIIETILFEFPLEEVSISVPGWICTLPKEHWLKKELYSQIKASAADADKIRSVREVAKHLSDGEHIRSAYVNGIDLGTGRANVELSLSEGLFFGVLGEESGFEIKDEEELIALIRELAESKKEYDKIAQALKQVREFGYGVVSPDIEELTLEEPKIIKQGGRYGVRLKASAPSIHIMCNKPKSLEAA